MLEKQNIGFTRTKGQEKNGGQNKEKGRRVESESVFVGCVSLLLRRLR
jgi:hypothetical protein